MTARFASVAGARLTLVTGPPGAGKTTSVREWVDSTGTRAAWLMLDTDDNAAPTLWRHVLASLRQIAPEIGTAPRGADGATRRPHATVGQVLDEVDALDGDVVLVLDDFQLVHSRSALGDLQVLLERKPPAFHVVVVSRSDPSLPLARWRVREELVDIRDADLRFRPDEAQSYLATFDDLRLDEHAVTTLTRRTEGWIAGLQLAVISLRSSDDPERFIDSFGGTDRFVADFLLDEVLAHQPEDVREFLLETSVLPRFDAALCDAVTGRHDAEMQLRRLDAANLFLVRSDPSGTSFRYHTLFRDLLRFELENREPERARMLREEAARELAREGDTLAAVALFVDAGNDDAAFSLALPEQAELPPRTRAARSTALDCITPAFVLRDRERALSYADALRKVGRHDDAAVWLERACATIGSRSADDRDRARSDAIWTGWYAAEGDAHAAVRHGDRAVRHASRRERAGDRLLATLGADLARSWLLLGNPARARRALAGLTSAADPLTNEVVVPALFARVQAREGRLRDAEISAERALRVAAALDVDGCPATIDALLARAAVRRERGEIEGASRDIDDAVELATELASRPYLVLARLEEVRNVAVGEGPADAMERLRSSRASFDDPLPLALADTVSRLDARLSAQCGDLYRAALIAATLPVGMTREMLLAQVEIAGGEAARARERLATLEPLTLIDRIRVELLRGMAAERLVDLRRHVALAAELAAPEGFRRIFIENGPAVSRALRSLATSARLPPLTVDLIGSLVDLPSLGAGARLVEPLSEREESVLRYFPTSLSYGDIATELLISVNTLKTHVRNIHRKLGVTSRADAVRQAEELGMLRRASGPRTAAG